MVGLVLGEFVATQIGAAVSSAKPYRRGSPRFPAPGQKSKVHDDDLIELEETVQEPQVEMLGAHGVYGSGYWQHPRDRRPADNRVVEASNHVPPPNAMPDTCEAMIPAIGAPGRDPTPSRRKPPIAPSFH